MTFVIVRRTCILAILAGYAAVSADQVRATEVSAQMAQALRSAKTASISVKQSYRNASATVEFHEVVKDLAEFAGWKVVEGGGVRPDVVIEIEAAGEAFPIAVEVGVKQYVKYLGVRASGRIAWRVAGVGEHVERFATTAELRVRDLINERHLESYSNPDHAPFHLLLWDHESRVSARWQEGEKAQVTVQRPFVAALVEPMGQAFGKRFLYDVWRRRLGVDGNTSSAALHLISHDPVYVEILLERLGHDDPRERESAASSLGGKQDPRIVGAVARLMADPAVNVRFAAAFTLQRLGAVEPLIDALDGVGHDEAWRVLKVVAMGKADHGKDKAAWRTWWSEQPKPAK